MTQLISFGGKPPAPYSELEKVNQKERQEREQARAQAVDNPLLIGDSLGDKKDIPDKLSPNACSSHVTKLSSCDKLSGNDKPSPIAKRSRRTDLPRLAKLHRDPVIGTESQPVQIIFNFCKRDTEVVKLMPSLTGDEWKVYCYLLSVTHEKPWQGETHCWTSHHVIKEETGLGCRRTVGLVLESLEAKGLIQRTFTGNKAVKMSQYRVFLPCELTGHTGETKVSYTPVKRNR